VHGDSAAFEAAVEGALAEDMFVLQLGDLTDHGPDSPAVLRRMFALIDQGQGLFLLGNHDHKLRRALTGTPVRAQPEGLGRTLEQLAAAPDGAALKARAIEEIGRAPAWIPRWRTRLRPWRLPSRHAAQRAAARCRGGQGAGAW
jgi:protein phosphatase